MRFRVIFLIGFLFFPTLTQSSPWGTQFSYSLVEGVPEQLKGYRAAITYKPLCFNWYHVKIYFDMAYGHWWVNRASPNSSLNSYSVAPYLRYYFGRNYYSSPFIEGSIGFAYLSKTRIDNRNLGAHFQFQDQITMGVTAGAKQEWDVGLGFVHYSNARLSDHNSGFSAPLNLNIGYRFC